MKNSTLIRKIGFLLLMLGMLALVGGVILLALTASSIAFWITGASVVLNILGIMLATTKSHD